MYPKSPTIPYGKVLFDYGSHGARAHETLSPPFLETDTNITLLSTGLQHKRPEISFPDMLLD